MEVYQLNADGMFVGEVTADPSPLELGQYLIPAGCVTVAPPTIPEGKQAWFVDGEWHLIDPPGAIAEPPTLEEAKFIKLVELGAWLQQQTATLEWEGAVYQTDDLARDRLMASLQMHQLGVRPDPSPWRTLDNSMVDLSGEALTALCAAVYLHHQEVTLASFEFKDQIEACTTIEEVQAIAFELS